MKFCGLWKRQQYTVIMGGGVNILSQNTDSLRPALFRTTLKNILSHWNIETVIWMWAKLKQDVHPKCKCGSNRHGVFVLVEFGEVHFNKIYFVLLEGWCLKSLGSKSNSSPKHHSVDLHCCSKSGLDAIIENCCCISNFEVTNKSLRDLVVDPDAIGLHNFIVDDHCLKVHYVKLLLLYPKRRRD